MLEKENLNFVKDINDIKFKIKKYLNYIYNYNLIIK